MKRRTAHPRADHPQAAGSRPAAGRGPGGPRGRQAAGGQRGDLSPLAGPVRRAEGRRRQPPEGAGGRERPAEADRGRQGAPDRGLEGAGAGKLVSPARRRRAVEHLQQVFGVSQRWACQLVGQHRSTQRHQPVEPDRDRALRQQLRAFSRAHPRWGYRRAHAQLREQGWRVNRKAVQRLWREEGLRVPARRRKRQRLGTSTTPGGPAGRRASRIMCGRWTTSSTRPPTAGS